MFRGAAAAGFCITLGLIAASASVGVPAASAATAGLPGPTQQCGPNQPAQAQSGTPWAQRALDYSSLWGFTQGAGVTVAVIDSGVDANPQFGGRVTVGQTYAKAPSGAAASDCVGHGTMVAGIIAAAPTAGTAFAGVAPQARILSLKVTNSSQTGISSTVLASAIAQAVKGGAKVINVSIDTPVDDPGLRAAVNYALSRDVVVVAATGNDDQPDPSKPPTHGPFYPADYPGVLSVAAVDSNGNLGSFSDKRTNVSVTAPGVNVTSTFPGVSGDSYAADQGTSFAAPFVSGLAALIRSRYPGLSAARVARLIEETADGPTGAGTGNGLVNPVQAVTSVAPSGAAPAATGPAARPVTVSVNRALPNRGEKVVAASLAGGAFAVAALVITAAVVIPAGRRRNWRPGL